MPRKKRKNRWSFLSLIKTEGLLQYKRASRAVDWNCNALLCSSSSAYPTEHFTVSEPQNPSIYSVYAVQTSFEAGNLWNALSGIKHQKLFFFSLFLLSPFFFCVYFSKISLKLFLRGISSCCCCGCCCRDDDVFENASILSCSCCCCCSDIRTLW